MDTQEQNLITDRIEGNPHVPGRGVLLTNIELSVQVVKETKSSLSWSLARETIKESQEV